MLHEPALRDWLKSELDGKSNGAEQVFAYLERHGISREEAVVPRKDRENFGGDRQLLVLAFFPNEEVADGAAMVMRNWDNASEHIKLDGIGVLAWDFEARAVADKLKEAGGTPQTHEVAKLPEQ